MSYKYRKTDFKKVSWEEYGKTLEVLYKKVNKYVNQNKLKIDAVVSILRGGAIPATYLAYKLGVLRILPVQYKYFYKGKNLELRKIFGFTRNTVKLPAKPTFLLVEGNHCFGLTAETAAKDLKRQFPGCRIVYAADHMDYSYQKNQYAEVIFFGRITNECRNLSIKECKAKGIDNPLSHLLPWEGIEEEYTTVQGKQFEYEDLSDSIKHSKRKETINISEIFHKE